MQGHKVILTWEAIYDATDITEYIEAEFGKERADKFQHDLEIELDRMEYLGNSFPQTQILYRGYSIHKKPFSPSIIFYVLIEQEIHILRVIREERDWQKLLNQQLEYSYPKLET